MPVRSGQPGFFKGRASGMTDREDSGPAFPASPSHYGMSLRDWFAGQALGLFSHVSSTDDRIAERSYRLADAMIKARKGGE